MTQSVKHLLAMLLAIFAMAAMSMSAVQAGTMALEMTSMDDGMASSGGDCMTDALSRRSGRCGSDGVPFRLRSACGCRPS